MCNLKYNTSQYICKTKTDSQIQRKDLKLLKGREGRGMDREFGVIRGKLSHIGWITNKILLYMAKLSLPSHWWSRASGRQLAKGSYI